MKKQALKHRRYVKTVADLRVQQPSPDVLATHETRMSVLKELIDVVSEVGNYLSERSEGRLQQRLADVMCEVIKEFVKTVAIYE